MKIRVEKITEGEEEVIIRYKELTSEIQAAIDCLDRKKSKIIGLMDGEQHLLKPEEIYYLESVDNIVFAYTKEFVYRTLHSLNELVNLYENRGYFRCNKSAVINIFRIASLKSEMGNRINATLINGEHIIISRRYAKELRALLTNSNKTGGEQE